MMAGLVLGFAGCSQAPEAQPSAAQQQERDREARELFAQLDAELTKLQDQLSDLTATAQERAEMQLSDLRDKRNALLQQYNADELKKTLAQAKQSVAEWSAAAQQAMEQANQKLQGAIDQAKESRTNLPNPFEEKPASPPEGN